MVRRRWLAGRGAYIAGVGIDMVVVAIAGTDAVGIAGIEVGAGIAEVDTVGEGTGAEVAGAVGFFPAEPVVVVVGQGWSAAGPLLVQ